VITDLVNDAKNNAKARRERRLGAALRENLKRRKAQARARVIEGSDPAGSPPSHDSAGIAEEDRETEG
jgi:hypothetical protein